jgi:two-component system cell cycle sensor histidine kinase/response regulator CckA
MHFVDASGPGTVTPTRFADRRGWLAAIGLVVLHLSHPVTWGQPAVIAWFAPVGVGTALVAWLGWRGVALVAVQTFLAAVQSWLLHRGVALGWDAAALPGVFWHALLAGAETGVAWWLFRTLAGRSRSLSDPQNATLFLLAAPGATAGFFSLLRVLPTGLKTGSFLNGLASEWTAHALGILAITPLLLVTLTPSLRRLRLAPAEPADGGLVDNPHFTAMEWMEVAGLAAGAISLGLLLALGHGPQSMASWQIWGIPLLLIVWASLRHGLWGATIIAGTSAIVSLACAGFVDNGGAGYHLLQGNVMAQCSTALLVGASAGLLRTNEARFRQVVGQVPTLLYSARVTEPAPEGRPPAAEVTFVSPAARQVLRCEPDELLGSFDRWLRRVHPADREVVLAALAQAGRQTQPVTCEYRLAPTGEPGSFQIALEHGGTQPEIVQYQRHTKNPDRWIRDTLAPRIGRRGELVGWDGSAVDITEHRQLADDLRRTTSMFYSLVANLPAGVFFMHYPSGRPILVNVRARQLLGQREDAAAGLPQFAEVYRLFRTDGTRYPLEEFPVSIALRRNVTAMRDDIVVHRPDGRRIPLVAWAAPIDLAGHGEPDAAVWVFEDLTSLRQAEVARRESQDRLRAVVETMEECLVVLNANGNIEELNPAACAFFGARAESLCALSLDDLDVQFLSESGEPLPVEKLPGALAGRGGSPVRNTVFGVDAKGAKGDGAGRRWLLVNAMPLANGTDLAGRRVVVTFTDITAHRLALDILQASEESYHGLVDSLPVMLLQFDRWLRVTYVNPAVADATGYSLLELREPAAWQPLLHPEDLPRLLAAAQKMMSDGQTSRLHLRYRVKDGSERTGYALLQPQRQADEIVGGVALIVDMTRERRLEQELQRAQRLEQAGQLASGIAHDFNNLLTVIAGMADLAHTSLAASHPARDDLRQILEVSALAQNLAGQLLAFGKERHVALHPVAVNGITRHTLKLLRSSLPASIKVEQALVDDELHAQSDELELQQVLINLCLNARDAMPSGGRLRIQSSGCERQFAECDGLRPWVVLSVADTGEGMTEHVRRHLFDTYFSTKELGNGLGLAVAQQIVANAGGHIEVWSEPGQGSRFDVWLPAAEVAAVSILEQPCAAGV